MAVSKETRRALYHRAHGRCECEMRICPHHKPGFFGQARRCPHGLSGSWEVHHRSTGGPDNLGNLIAMCVTCHKNTRTYGRG